MRAFRRHRGRTALLILDLISDYSYPNGAELLSAARRIAPSVAKLRDRSRRNGAPVLYVNDTRDQWESDQSAFIGRCVDASPSVAKLLTSLLPGPEDFFMFKPRHSAFYATPLESLLERLGSGTLVLTGITSHQCVLFTAIDAHVRGFDVIVPRDAIAAASRVETRHALFVLEHSVGARIVSSRSIRFARSTP